MPRIVSFSLCTCTEIQNPAFTFLLFLFLNVPETCHIDNSNLTQLRRAWFLYGIDLETKIIFTQIQTTTYLYIQTVVTGEFSYMHISYALYNHILIRRLNSW